MARIPVVSVSAPINDPVAVMNTCRSYVSMFQDPVIKDESELKALQELSEKLETFVSTISFIFGSCYKNFHQNFRRWRTTIHCRKNHTCIFMSYQWIILHILMYSDVSALFKEYLQRTALLLASYV